MPFAHNSNQIQLDYDPIQLGHSQLSDLGGSMQFASNNLFTFGIGSNKQEKSDL